MKKRIAITVFAVFMLIVGISAGIHFGRQYNGKDISVYVSAPSSVADGSSYIYGIMFGGMPDNLSKKKQIELDGVIHDLDSFYASFRSEQEKPYYVEALYENTDDGKTLITFKGQITDSDSGELKDFEKVFSYDFIITENIDSNTKRDSLKYFK